MRRVALFALAASLAACTTYTPAPLPDSTALAAAPHLDLARLEVAARSLDHPLLAPIVLDLSDGLSPAEAAVLAVLLDPDLVAARDARGEREAQLVAAGLLPNPTFEAEAARPRGAAGKDEDLATTFRLGFAVSDLVGRAARRDEARAELARVDLEIAWKEWQVAQAARLRALRLGWLARRSDLLARELGIERRESAELSRAAATGDTPAATVVASRAVVEELRSQAGELARGTLEARRELAALLGAPAGGALPISSPAAATGEHPLPDADALLATALAHRLDLEALRRGYAAEEARLRQAVLAQFPDLTIGVVREHEEGVTRFPGGFVNIDLPIFDRAQGRIAAERATRRRLHDELVARVAGLRAELAGLAGEEILAGERRAAVAAAARALAPRVETMRRALERGDVDRISYAAARRELFALRRQELAWSQARAESRVAVEAAAGVASLGSPAAGGVS